MSKDGFEFGRRTVLKGIGCVGFTAATSHAGAVAASSPDEIVSTGQAETAADTMIAYYGVTRETHETWQDASAGSPTTYYMIVEDGSYEPAAHVFPVESVDGRTAGHIAVAARRSWPPVLEYSIDKPPSAGRSAAEDAARSVGFEPTGRLLYQGALDFGIQVSADQMIHLGSRKLAPVRQTSELLAHDVDGVETVDVARQWQLVEDGALEPESQVGSDASEHLDFDQYAWDGHYAEGPAEGSPDGDASGGQDYPANRGLADDSWDAWDGCTPIAGTQIIMFHENLGNYSWNVEERGKICDALHHLMHTNDAGWSDTWNVDDGFDEIGGELGFLDNDYDGANEYNLSKNLVKSEIEGGRPFVLTNYDAPVIGSLGDGADGPGSQKKNGDNYNGHSVVGSGYDENGSLEIDVYEGWNTNLHTLTYGSWDSTTMITRVTPQ